jgi:hypothetical protein
MHKAILYLGDVRGENAPFTIMQGYPKRTVRGFELPDLPLCKGEVEESGTQVLRFQAAHVTKLLKDNPGAHPVEVHAPAGSVSFFDVTRLHIGKLARTGARSSVTTTFRGQRAEETRRREVLYPGNSSTAQMLRWTASLSPHNAPFIAPMRRKIGRWKSREAVRKVRLDCRDIGKWWDP